MVIGIFRKSTTGVFANMSVHVSKPFVGFVLLFQLLSNSQSADMRKFPNNMGVPEIMYVLNVKYKI